MTRPTRSWMGYGLALLLALLLGCGKSVELPRLATDDVVLAFGDSLTFGIGAAEHESYPAVLASLLNRKVVGAGVPGETTSEGLARLPQLLDEHQPRLLVLCEGGNDMLRKQSHATIKSNLAQMIQLAQARGTAVALIAVPEPKLFSDPPELYAELAQRFRLAFEGEILDDVLHQQSLKSDAIHPNAQGYRKLAEAIAALLREAGAI